MTNEWELRIEYQLSSDWGSGGHERSEVILWSGQPIDVHPGSDPPICSHPRRGDRKQRYRCRRCVWGCGWCAWECRVHSGGLVARSGRCRWGILFAGNWVRRPLEQTNALHSQYGARFELQSNYTRYYLFILKHIKLIYWAKWTIWKLVAPISKNENYRIQRLQEPQKHWKKYFNLIGGNFSNKNEKEKS